MNNHTDELTEAHAMLRAATGEMEKLRAHTDTSELEKLRAFVKAWDNWREAARSPGGDMIRRLMKAGAEVQRTRDALRT